MTRKNAALVFLAGLSGVLAAAAACEAVALRRIWRQLKQAQSLEAFHALQARQRGRDAEAAEARAKALEAQLAEAKASPTAERDKAAADAKHGRTAVGLVDGWLAAMNSSEVLRLRSAQIRSKIEGRYAPLFNQLHLTPEQAGKVTELLVAKREAGVDAAVGAVQQDINPLDDPKGFDQAVQVSRSEIEDEIKAALGDTAYAQYQQFNAGQNQQAVVNRLQQSLSGTPAPLTGEQAQLFQELLADSQTNHITPDVMDVAKGFLSAPQVAALQQIQQNQQRAQQLRRAQQQAVQSLNEAVAGR